jgi:hypothetical protein
MEHKGELFLVAFVAALVAVPIIDYIYDMIAPRFGLPTI